MTNVEYELWRRHMLSCRGRWTRDQVHDGLDGRDLLCYVPLDGDATAGMYVDVSVDGRATAGAFEGAIPHIGDAIFIPRWERKFVNPEEALKVLGGRLGVVLPANSQQRGLTDGEVVILQRASGSTLQQIREIVQCESTDDGCVGCGIRSLPHPRDSTCPLKGGW
jgi:hypothetical protein